MSFSANTLPQNFTPTPPTLKDLLDTFGKNLMIDFSCHHIGTIQSFDSSKQTATVSINYQKTFYKLDPATQQYNAVQLPYPLLLECPVIIFSGGITALTMPIEQGDECIVLFNDRDISNWYNGSITSGVATNRLHSLSDGLVLVGLNSLANSLASYDSNRAVLRAGDSPGTMAAVGVNKNNSKVLISNTYPSNSTTLKTLLQQLTSQLEDLCSAIESITVGPGTFIAGTNPVVGTSGTPINASDFSDISSQISSIATSIGGLLE